MRQERFQITATYAAEIELEALKKTEHVELSLVEEIEAIDAMTIDLLRRGQFVETSYATEEVVKGR